MTIKSLNTLFLSTIFLVFSSISNANEVDIVNVKATQSKDKSWRFDVTLKHEDEGWDHYANEWQVLAPDNKILATRTLYHPHDHEQPFTRSTQGVKIPDDMNIVRIIAKDTVHGLAKKAVEINLESKKIRTLSLEQLKKIKPQKG